MTTQYWGNQPLENSLGLEWATLLLEVPNPQQHLAEGLDSSDLHHPYAASFLLVLGCPYWQGNVIPQLEKAIEKVKVLIATPEFLRNWPDRPLILTATLGLVGRLRWRLEEYERNGTFEAVGGPDEPSETFRRVLAARMRS